jgi:hypothetical protein
MTAQSALSREDGRLVDLVNAVLVDPNVHTDLRMRLHDQIAELIEQTARAQRARTSEEAKPAELRLAASAPSEPGGGDPRLAELLRAVLVDANLHTELRLRLHRQITELVAAHDEAARPRVRELNEVRES